METSIEKRKKQLQHLLTIDDLARAWKVPKSKIYSLTRQKGHGAIPVIKIGKYCRFDPDKVEEWLREQNEAD